MDADDAQVQRHLSSAAKPLPSGMGRDRRSGRRLELDGALVRDVLLDDGQRCAADSGNEVVVRPQCRQPAPQVGELLSEQPRRSSLDLLDKSMDAVLGVDADEDMNVVGHRLHLDELAATVGADLAEAPGWGL